jgi:two-component system KDP operon response regulator KdpE
VTGDTPSVLLVDDHPKLVNFIRLGLKFAGFDVTPVGTGRDAIDSARSDSYDVMLLDIRMPDMDGFEVLRQVRGFSRMPVIAYSATPEYSDKALQHGADAFIAKPFQMDKLVETIRGLVDRRE